MWRSGDPLTATEVEEYEAELLPYEDVAAIQMGDHKVEPEAAMPDRDDEPTPEEMDEYVQMQVLLPRGEGCQRAVVTHRKRDAEGNMTGQRSNNPFLDTRVYGAEFPDGVER